MIDQSLLLEPKDSRAVVSVKYCPSGTHLACAASDKRIYLFNTSTGHLVTTLEGEHLRGINDCAWISDTVLASGSDDQTLKVWDISVGKAVCTFKYLDSFVYCLSINPQNKTILSGSSDGRLCFYHLSTRDPIMNFDAHSETVASIDCQSNGREIISAGHDGLARVWSTVFSSCCIKTVVCDGDQQQLTPFSCVRYSPNGKYILLSSLNSLHRLYDRESFIGFGKNWTEYDRLKAKSDVQWSPSSKWNPTPKRQYSGHINNKYSSHSCFHHNETGSFILSGSENGEVILWELNSSKINSKMQAHSAAVLSVASRDGFEISSQFATSSLDGSVKMYNIRRDTYSSNSEL